MAMVLDFPQYPQSTLRKIRYQLLNDMHLKKTLCIKASAKSKPSGYAVLPWDGGTRELLKQSLQENLLPHLQQNVLDSS